VSGSLIWQKKRDLQWSLVQFASRRLKRCQQFLGNRLFYNPIAPSFRFFHSTLCSQQFACIDRISESEVLFRLPIHVGFMREPQQGVDNFANAAESVLAPARTRLKQQIVRARERADKNEYEALGPVENYSTMNANLLTSSSCFSEKTAVYKRAFGSGRNRL
jgi:hypothetical protein